jgi:uncharacterized protein
VRERRNEGRRVAASPRNVRECAPRRKPDRAPCYTRLRERVASIVLLFFVAILGGALNAVAGGGSFFVFPALLFLGVPPVVANATTAAGLMPASFSSAIAYRKDFAYDRQLLLLAIASTVGGVLGAIVLLKTKESTFVFAIPILLGFAAAVFTFGARIAAYFRARVSGAHGITIAFFVQLVIATYGGYFGGGMGILMLATFAFIGLSDIHATNGMKSVLAVLINGAAIVAFVYSGKVMASKWAVIVVGGVLGGYFGARVARRISPSKVRVAVIVYAWIMTAYFAWRTYA